MQNKQEEAGCYRSMGAGSVEDASAACCRHYLYL